MASKTICPGIPAQNANPISGAQPFSQLAGNPQIPQPQPMPQPVMPQPQQAALRVEDKPIMGMLFSVSKTNNGEFWPVYVGPNTIGKAANNSVCLSEQTVSENHATLVVRKMMNNGQDSGVFVFIQDTGSIYGTQINGVTLDFNPRECKNGDIITIGENYQLYFVLLDHESLGLHKSDNFKSTVPVQPAASQVPVMNTGWGGANPGIYSGQPMGTSNNTSPFGGNKTQCFTPGKK